MATSQSEQATLREESDIDGDRITRPYESDVEQEKARIDNPQNDFSADEKDAASDRGQVAGAVADHTKTPPTAPGPPMPGGTPPDGGLQAWMQVAGAFM